MNAETKVKAASFSADLVKALAEIEGATKDRLNPHFKSKYADLGSVMDAIKPALAKYDLAFTQVMHVAEDGVCVETVIHHSSGDSLSCGKLYVPADKRNAQGFGSALTYARRYGLMTAFGVPSEDDDGNEASRPTPRADHVVLPPITDSQNDADSTTHDVAAPPKGITDGQRDLIQTIAPAAGRSIQAICEAYKVGALTALTESQGTAIIKRLQEVAKDLEPAK